AIGGFTEQIELLKIAADRADRWPMHQRLHRRCPAIVVPPDRVDRATHIATGTLAITDPVHHLADRAWCADTDDETLLADKHLARQQARAERFEERRNPVE